jgi:hypothetical protein
MSGCASCGRTRGSRTMPAASPSTATAPSASPIHATPARRCGVVTREITYGAPTCTRPRKRRSPTWSTPPFGSLPVAACGGRKRCTHTAAAARRRSRCLSNRLAMSRGVHAACRHALAVASPHVATPSPWLHRMSPRPRRGFVACIHTLVVASHVATPTPWLCRTCRHTHAVALLFTHVSKRARRSTDLLDPLVLT